MTGIEERVNPCVLEGALSVEAAVRYASRRVERCYIDREKVKKRDRKLLALLKLLKEHDVPTELCQRSVIDAFLEKQEQAGSTHGGVIALCGERVFLSPEELLDKTAREGGFCVILDGMEDPFNFGYAVRNLYAAGASGILVPPRNWMYSAGVCARASAGATEMCPMALLPEMSSDREHEDFMRKLKKAGFLTVCAAKTKQCEELFSFEPEFPLALFIGGEKRGISPGFVENADCIVSIPYYSDARFSLPAASTAAIFGFLLGNTREKNRQEGEHPPRG